MARRKIGRVRRMARNRGYVVAGLCVALAVGGIVLLRSEGRAAPMPPTGVATGHGITSHAGGGTFTASGATLARFSGPVLSGHAALAQGAVLAHGTRDVLMELELNAAEDGALREGRQSVAISVVLDTSGSMSGEKIAQARNAVRELVQRMEPSDRIALITYDTDARVVQPLASVGEVERSLLGQIGFIRAGGGTNIPAGLELGASQLTTADDGMVRRVVLVSDGRDGSGRPVEVVAGDLRRRAALSVSSLGIGVDYDERYLTTVADAGRGNYEFLASGAELERFLHRELEEASDTTVDRVRARVALPAGWQVREAFGAELDREAGAVSLPVGPMVRGARRRVVLALDVTASDPGPLGALDVTVDYRTVADGATHHLAGGKLALAAVTTQDEAIASRQADVYARSQAVVLEAQQAQAVEAWRRGDAVTAKRITARNVGQLRDLQAQAPEAAAELAPQLEAYEADDEAFDMPAASAEGRAYGLRSNAARRQRVMK